MPKFRMELGHPAPETQVGEIVMISPGHGIEGQPPGQYRITAYGTWIDLEPVEDPDA